MFLVKAGQVSNHLPARNHLDNKTIHADRIWPYFKTKFGSIVNKIWHFILEAKDLKPATTKTLQTQVEKVKNAFRIRIRSSEADPQWLPEAAELATKQEPNQTAEELYLRAIQKNPQDQQAYEALGRLYLQNKNFKDAVEIFEHLIKLSPSRDTYHSNLGLAYFSLKEFQKAARSYEQALSINNKIPTRWVNLSFCFSALEDYPKAVKALTSAVGLDKYNLNYLTLLVDAYLKVPNHLRAEEVLEQILSIDPTNKTAREKLMKLKI